MKFKRFMKNFTKGVIIGSVAYLTYFGLSKAIWKLENK